MVVAFRWLDYFAEYLVNEMISGAVIRSVIVMGFEVLHCEITQFRENYRQINNSMLSFPPGYNKGDPAS